MIFDVKATLAKFESADRAIRAIRAIRPPADAETLDISRTCDGPPNRTGCATRVRFGPAAEAPCADPPASSASDPAESHANRTGVRFENPANMRVFGPSRTNRTNRTPGTRAIVDPPSDRAEATPECAGPSPESRTDALREAARLFAIGQLDHARRLAERLLGRELGPVETWRLAQLGRAELIARELAAMLEGGGR